MIIHHHQDVFATQAEITKIRLIVQFVGLRDEILQRDAFLYERITEKILEIYIAEIDHSPHQDVFAYTSGNNKNPANCTSCVRPKEMKFYKEMRSLMKRNH